MDISHKHAYRPDLDGLRAIAVLSVIINHFDSKLLPGGFLGVDIFFILSGFVVTSSLSQKEDGSWSAYLSEFYSRRIKRLLPGLLICVVSTSILGCLFIQDPIESLRTGVYSIVGMSNVYLYKHSSDYFGLASENNLFTHTWSLAVEEQFYLIFPLILGLCGFSRKKKKNGRKITFFVILFLSLLSFISYLLLSKANPSFSFYLMPARFWELGIGSLVFIVSSQLAFKKVELFLSRNAVSVLVFILLLLSMFFPGSYQTYSRILLSVLTVLLIISIRSENIIHRFLTQKNIVQIGLLSYSLYLWHWPVFTLSRFTVGLNLYSISFLSFFFLFSLIVLLRNLSALKFGIHQIWFQYLLDYHSGSLGCLLFLRS